MRCSAALLLATLLCSATSYAQSGIPIKQAVSPNGRIALAVKGIRGSLQIAFTDTRDGRELGDVLPREEEDRPTVRGVVASWSKNSAKVAILLYYGSKWVSVCPFERDDASGEFHQVDFEEPDAVQMHNKRRRNSPVKETDYVYPEDSLGPWQTEDTIRLISGSAVDVKGTIKHLLLTYNLRLTGGKAEILNVKLVGPLSDRESEKFFDKWGKVYWSLE